MMVMGQSQSYNAIVCSDKKWIELRTGENVYDARVKGGWTVSVYRFRLANINNNHDCHLFLPIYLNVFKCAHNA